MTLTNTDLDAYTLWDNGFGEKPDGRAIGQVLSMTVYFITGLFPGEGNGAIERIEPF